MEEDILRKRIAILEERVSLLESKLYEMDAKKDEFHNKTNNLQRCQKFNIYFDNKLIYANAKKGNTINIIVKDYAENVNPTIDYNSLKEIFNDSIQGKCTIRTVEESVEMFLNSKNKDDYKRRFAFDKQIALHDGTKIVTSTQFGGLSEIEIKRGVTKSNFDRFIETAKKLGYDIKEAER